MEEANRVDPVKKMAELIKAGAVMLAETCPVPGCGLPLFRTKTGEVVCPVHGRVYLVKTDDEAREIKTTVGLSIVLDKIEERALLEINSMLSDRVEIEPTDLIKWLEVIERVRRIKSILPTVAGQQPKKS
ncbi:Sjogren's syndrome/scleroderma autoantigen 1 family protein [Thermogladius sp. 4427co]|uniref:Sjogren's syndrome/scleroderma autoantigen 1 family protein n=1 Tax=Thermogladius sp. 4427co TaxID=3450718 RepID=UPI003F7988FA